MTNTFNPTGTGTGTFSNTIQASDIKALLQKQGKVSVNNKGLTLKAPAFTDHKLQEIIRDDSFSVKALGTPNVNGENEFELSGNGNVIKIKVDCKTF